MRFVYRRSVGGPFVLTVLSCDLLNGTNANKDIKGTLKKPTLLPGNNPYSNLPFSAIRWEGESPPFSELVDIKENPYAWKTTMAKMLSFLFDIEKKNIKVLRVISPQNPAYSNIGATGIWGYYGPSLKVASKIQDSVDAFANLLPNLKNLDQHQFGNHDYTDADALNASHLATPGAVKISTQIDSILRTWQ